MSNYTYKLLKKNVFILKLSTVNESNLRIFTTREKSKLHKKRNSYNMFLVQEDYITSNNNVNATAG